MAEGAPKAPVVAEAHEVDTFRESCATYADLQIRENRLASLPVQLRVQVELCC